METAWAAGLFDGEGSVTICRGRPRLQLKMVDEESVRRYRDAMGVGKVYGPYANRSGEKDGYPRRDFFMFVAEGADADVAVALMLPWLSTVRKARIAEVFHPKEEVGSRT